MTSKGKNRFSSLALLAANSIALIGVLFWSWNVGNILLAYWLESAVIGFYSILKLIVLALNYPEKKSLAKNELSAKNGTFLMIGFFIAHFGFFMYGHLEFLMAFFGRTLEENLRRSGIFHQTGYIFEAHAALILSLFLSHGISFALNFIGNREYEKFLQDPPRSAPKPSIFIHPFFSPYTRIADMHIILMAGGFVSMLLGQGLIISAAIVIFKITLDMHAHLTGESFLIKKWNGQAQK